MLGINQLQPGNKGTQNVDTSSICCRWNKVIHIVKQGWNKSIRNMRDFKVLVRYEGFIYSCAKRPMRAPVWWSSLLFSLLSLTRMSVKVHVLLWSCLHLVCDSCLPFVFFIIWILTTIFFSFLYLFSFVKCFWFYL